MIARAGFNNCDIPAFKFAAVADGPLDRLVGPVFAQMPQHRFGLDIERGDNDDNLGMKDRLGAAMLAAAREEGHAVIPPWTLHDLRRTFVTGMVELHVPPHVVELVVNHISGTRAGVAGTYNRSELLRERKAALNAGHARARPRGAMAGQRG